LIDQDQTNYGEQNGYWNWLDQGSNNAAALMYDSVQGKERQHAIPFIQKHTVLEIDLVTRKMRVDWDADF